MPLVSPGSTASISTRSGGRRSAVAIAAAPLSTQAQTW
jgi:hypothetical protein